MQAELNALIKRGTWEEVDLPPNTATVDSRWVFKMKWSPDRSEVKMKSRLVARGFSQEYGVNYFETYAPVVKSSCVRLLMSVAVECGMIVEQIDVKNAYVNCDLEDVVYMKPPEGLKLRRSGSVLKLKKSLYGLKQSGNKWNKCINELLSNMKFERLKSEPCIYKRGEKRAMVILALYVDDILIFASTQTQVNVVKDELKRELEIDDIGPCQKVIGMDVECSNGEIKISQVNLIKSILLDVKLEECKGRRAPLNSGERLKRCESTSDQCGQINGTEYRSLLGKLNYLASTTRPDLSFSVSYLSQFCQCPHREHMQAARSVARYLATTANRGIRYIKRGGPFVAYADADWAQCVNDRKSYSGYVVLHSGGPVAWEAKKQPTIALSSTEAEYMAMTNAAKEIKFLRNILEELELQAIYNGEEITLNIDNQGAIKLASHNGYSPRTKHIDVRHHFIREAVENKILKLEYVASEENLADIFTKPLGPVIHKRIGDKILNEIKTEM